MSPAPGMMPMMNCDSGRQHEAREVLRSHADLRQAERATHEGNVCGASSERHFYPMPHTPSLCPRLSRRA
jgi:hypothetical protein